MSARISNLRSALARRISSSSSFFNPVFSDGQSSCVQATQTTRRGLSSKIGNFALPLDNPVMHTLNLDPKLPHGLNVRSLHTLKNPANTAVDEAVYEQLSTFLPPSDHPEFATRQKWLMHLISHKFTVSADFVAQLGHAVHLIDVRLEHELTGPVGYIPGVNWFPRSDVNKILECFPEDGLIAIVCNNDSDSREVVRTLKANGRHFAAILAGGMRTWKLMGFSTSRDPSILNRKCIPVRRPATVPCPTNRAGKRQMTLQQISEHIGNGESLQWIKMAAFMVHGRLSCVDGRDDCGVIGTPGGDMGEFIIGLAVAEDLLNRPLTDAEVAVLFQRRLDAFGRFYMHTDQACLDKLVKALQNDPHLAGKLRPATSPLAMTALMHSVPVELRERVLMHMIEPDHVGCGHIRLLLNHSEKYRVRRGLVVTALRCFFYAGWDGATECDFVVLSGRHEECGVANVTLTNEVHPFTRIPLIPPAIQGNQVFVNHEQISAYLRHQMADWVLAQKDVLPLSKTAAAAFQPMMDLLADTHAHHTLGALASDLPMYTLKFDESGYCEVHYNGIISPPQEEKKEDDHGHHHGCMSAGNPDLSSSMAPIADASVETTVAGIPDGGDVLHIDIHTPSTHPTTFANDFVEARGGLDVEKPQLVDPTAPTYDAQDSTVVVESPLAQEFSVAAGKEALTKYHNHLKR